MFTDFLFKSITVSILAIGVIFASIQIAGPITFNTNTVTTQKDSLFEVTDSAKVFAQPDTATIQVSVIKKAKTVEAAQTELNESNNKTLQALKDLGIEESKIKTVYFDISPQYRYNPENGEQTIDGYNATSRLEVRTTDFDKINQIVDAAIKAGANEVGQVQFIVDNKEEYIAQARKEAIQKAKTKAQDIASEAGISLGRLLDIQVYESGQDTPAYNERAIMTMDAGIGGGGTSIQAGQNEIQVNVQLFYALN